MPLPQSSLFQAVLQVWKLFKLTKPQRGAEQVAPGVTATVACPAAAFQDLAFFKADQKEGWRALPADNLRWNFQSNTEDYENRARGQELHDLLICQFQISENQVLKKKCVIYTKRNSKNHKPRHNKSVPEHMREPCISPDNDVVSTFTTMFEHQANWKDKTAESERFLFMQPIPNPASNHWFSSQRIGVRSLSRTLNGMAELCKIDKRVTNKSWRITMITKQVEKGVPSDVGMKRTGHKTLSAYKRYDRNIALQQDTASEVMCLESELNFQDALEKNLGSFTGKAKKVNCPDADDIPCLNMVGNTPASAAENPVAFARSTLNSCVVNIVYNMR